MGGGCGRPEGSAPAISSAPADVSQPAAAESYRYAAAPMPTSTLDGVIPFSDSYSEPPSQFHTEAYDHISENDFQIVASQPLSTFSIDVDTASYANVRRFLNQGQLPPPGAVRIEELVNYFAYHDAGPTNDEPFAVHAEVAGCPWEPKHRLVRFGLKGKKIDRRERPASNLVFLIDVSGSMQHPQKLPLVKQSLELLLNELVEGDRVAIVIYAGRSGLALPSTPAESKGTILNAVRMLQAGGSTNGGEGIQTAYRVAVENYIEGGVNRVILCTDGDFNVGISDRSQLVALIEEKARSGVFLSILGYGTGNLKDAAMEQLADKGNGNYGYVDSLQEARKLLVEQMSGTLVTIAKDVKLQIEFNPRHVAAYRLIGYENRVLAAQDFKDDAKDAGEIGAGHTVTALYELIPAGVESTALAGVDPLRYQQTGSLSTDAFTDEVLALKLRYKQPDDDVSREIRFALRDEGCEFARASDDFRFAACVAAFGMLLRDSKYKGDITLPAVAEMAQTALADDLQGYRSEFVALAQRASAMRR
jgi:Ca-activated chloride channel family protein